MILDMTYCSGLRCGKANTCYRWIKHLEDYLRSPEGKRHRDRPISMAQFDDGTGRCTHYIPKEEKEPAPLAKGFSEGSET